MSDILFPERTQRDEAATKKPFTTEDAEVAKKNKDRLVVFFGPEPLRPTMIPLRKTHPPAFVFLCAPFAVEGFSPSQIFTQLRFDHVFPGS